MTLAVAFVDAALYWLGATIVVLLLLCVVVVFGFGLLTKLADAWNWRSRPLPDDFHVERLRNKYRGWRLVGFSKRNWAIGLLVLVRKDEEP